MSTEESSKQADEYSIGILERGMIVLCYIVGIGSILYGSLSGVKYGLYYFVPIGFLALLLMIIHVSVRAVEFNEKVKILPAYVNTDVGCLVICSMIFYVGLFLINGRLLIIDFLLLIGAMVLLARKYAKLVIDITRDNKSTKI